MSQKLYVGGLSWDTDEEGLRNAFTSFGDLEEVTVVKDKYSGRSRGFGFVTFRAPDAATKAIEKMNGMMLDGRSLTVNEARDRGPSGGGGGRGGRSGDSRGGRQDW